MTIIIVAFHILLVIGIVLMFQALAERKKLKALAASKTVEHKPEAVSAVPTEPVNEQKKAVQIVHHGLENVMRHLTSIEGHSPEMGLAEISATAGSITDKTNLELEQMANGGTNEIT